MANEMITWARRQVFDQFELSGPERFILMLLADNASFDEETGLWSSWPFQKTLAHDSGYSERAVIRAVKRFCDLGLVSIEPRYKKSGAKTGNTYRFHPEAVNQPIARTEALPEYSRGDTVSGLEYSRHDTQSGAPAQPREFKTRHTVRSPRQGDPNRLTVRSHLTHSQVPRAKTDAGASLTIIEPSSSSMSPSVRDEDRSPAGAGETTTKNESDLKEHEPESQPVRFGTCRVANARGTVDLDKLVAVVAGHWTVTVDRDRAVWLAEAIIGRSARTVGSPDAFVRRSLVNDGHDWQEAVIDRFGADMTGDQSSALKRGDDRKCPIPHHADSGWKAHNCPGCRKQLDFPNMLDRSIYEALDPEVRDLIDRDQTVTVVEVPVNSDRTRSPIGRSSDRSVG